MSDSTESTPAESTLAEYQHLFFEGMDVLPWGVFLLDGTGSVVWVNRWLDERFAETPWLGRDFGELLGDAGNGGAEPFGEGRASTWIVPEADGSTERLEISICTVSSEAGQRRGAIGRVEDISERMRAEAGLQEELRRRRTLVEQSPDGIIVLEESGRVYEANQHFADMIGYPLDEVYRLGPWDWDARFGREEIRQMLGLANEKGHRVETSFRRRDGSLADVEMSTNASVFAGRKLIFCVCRDITERRRELAERELLIESLRRAVNDPRDVPELLSMCAFCKKIRDEPGKWVALEVFLSERLDRLVSHGICPQCLAEHYSGSSL